MPIILVSPFWDDTKPIELNYKGGYVDFRNAFNTSYLQASWKNLASKQDGYFKRPLCYTDRDINYIYSNLSDIPIILVHGTIQGVHTPQQNIQRICPHITFWNLFPEQKDSYTSLNLNFFPLQLPIGINSLPDIDLQIGEYSLYLQDNVGKYLTKAIGLLSSFYHLYHFESRPNLQQFQLDNILELEALSLQVSCLYDFLSQKNPSKADYYKFQKETLFLECEIDKLRRSYHFTQFHNTSLKLEVRKEEDRRWFANQLITMIDTIDEFQCQIRDEIGLDLSSFTDSLKEAIRSLVAMKFRFLIIGDLNRGKSTILNVLLGQELLPTAPIATTAIPIFVKYGKQEKVLVHKKDGSQEELSLEEYKQRYSLNSKELRNQIKYSYKSEKEWLSHLDHAELYYPIELLSGGVEFIDTAGFNNQDIRSEQIFTTIQESHVIIFILSADQPFTKIEKEYLHYLVSDDNQIRKPIFYVINKWYNLEDVPEKEKEEIHRAFVEVFCNCLKINENGAEKMWGDTVFNVYDKIGLENLKQRETLDDTGLQGFTKRLDDFIMNERLTTEIDQAMQIAEFVKVQILSQVSERLTKSQDEPEINRLIANISQQLETLKTRYKLITSLAKI
ncbi:dynamin family protein [Anabaena sp. PCC 7108]|uniref:dynamin family protein n=1 Tax=Anabaena sp. PCC 7108 TaxID=163908 RepID=UPI00034C95D2|nr:dynamin family protein [Anabaena sp. PCC 7108]